MGHNYFTFTPTLLLEMSTFEDWLKTITNSSVLKYADRLIELGASWETFEGEKDDTISDLVDAKIPLLAAKTIFNLAAEALKIRNQPLSIFWDLENVPIPTNSSGIEVVSRIKSLLDPLGNLVQFRGYASIGLNHIPEQKRSELQLSGCDLVDCPHNGRKEVADKMIIVDAMEFAFTRIQEGATMCFITSDIDYAYLLAKLQKPQWKTIVISKGSRDSMLQVNCNIKFQWETDVLQIKHAPPPPPGFQSLPLNTSIHIQSTTESFLSIAAKPLDSSKQEAEKCSPDILQDIGEGNEGTIENIETPKYISYSKIDECGLDLLRSMIAEYAHVGGNRPGVSLKCHICSLLRQQYPSRFPNRKSIQEFISNAIESGGIIEGPGQDQNRLLYLPEEFKGPPLSRVVPIPFDEIPQKMLELTSQLPFIIFLKKCQIPPGSRAPEKVFIQSSGKWMILMFRTLNDMQHVIGAKPWLASGHLIDWRKTTKPIPKETHTPLERFPCNECEKMIPVTESFISSEHCLCRSCFIASPFWTEDEMRKVTEKVVSALEMLAYNDDVFLPQGILRKMLQERWPVECSSRSQATLWMEVALRGKAAYEAKRKCGKNKSKIIYLPKNSRWVTIPWPEEEIDTNIEEEYVLDLLWNRGCLPRSEVINSLQTKFPHMSTPLKRGILFFNAAANGNFFIAKNAYGQIVGLSKEDASSTLLNFNGDSFSETEASLNSSASSIESSASLHDISDSSSDESDNLKILLKHQEEK